ncbi:MAG: threonine synthase [Planctomycetes bacterium]|nr:threonine synthase [Planctomycetota bacterium]
MFPLGPARIPCFAERGGVLGTPELICEACGRRHPASEPLWRCPCGGLLDLEFEARFPLDAIRGRRPTLWRYREAIPVDRDEHVVSFDEGFTPLLPLDFGGRTAWVKQDHLFPSGSFKDRGSTVLVSKARELGVRRLVEDSSGNAGASIAAYGARAGIECEIVAPASASPAKLAQIRRHGARLHAVPGPREEAAREALRLAEASYYASHVWNPFFVHGTKTFAYEVCEQLGWKAPDAVVVPAGNGTLLLGARLGFGDLAKAGVIRRVPRLFAVQAAACAPAFRAFSSGADEVAAVEWAPTAAEGIAVAAPRRGRQMLEAVRSTGGAMLAVGEEEIRRAGEAMARRGFLVEPTAAAGIAGLEAVLAASRPGETIVGTITGHGLKGPLPA